MSRRCARLAAALVAGAVLLGGCSPSAPREPRRTPVPDEEIFEAVSQIPGVESHTLSYNTNFGSTGYNGDVIISQDADPYCVLDTTLALLRQGRAYLSVSVRQGDEFTDPWDLDSDLPLATAFQERYGPRTDDGILREVDPPACHTTAPSQ
ncbi:hypothetical protein [Actinotalea sp. C106]|uniref:hypothetical protein n=1 Tax=Actinotalea sp. C106 TaxID=2908644 RepID=UPI002027E77F|nr:hypothetical protein [Actinotalea sp. C106]